MKKIIIGFFLLINNYLFSQCVDTVWVPNAFVLDGNSETFKPVTPGNNQWEIYIFSRGGELIYNSSEVGWDGTYLGKNCQSGVYVYRINVYGNDCVRQLKGSVTIL